MKKKFFLFLWTSVAVLFQISFIQMFPFPFSHFNIALPFIIILVISGKYDKALVFAGSVGILLGLYTYKRFGIDALAMLGATIFIYILYQNIFTHTSYLSIIILGTGGYIFYTTAYYLINIVYFYLKLVDTFPSRSGTWLLLLQCLFNACILVLFRYLSSLPQIYQFIKKSA